MRGHSLGSSAESAYPNPPPQLPQLSQHAPMESGSHFYHDGGGGGLCAAAPDVHGFGVVAGGPPLAASFLRKAQRFAQAHTPEGLRSLASFVGCSRFLTMSVDTGLQGEERKLAAREALLVVHLAAGLFLWEVGHAARLSCITHRRHRQAQERQRRKKRKGDGDTPSAGGEVSELSVSTPSNRAATPTPAKEGADQRGDDEDGPPVAAPSTAAAAASAPRGHRLMSYWSLVEAAVQGGSRKAPSPPIAVEDILKRAKTDSTMGVPASASTEGGGSGDSLLVLPEEFSFAVSPLARSLLSCTSHPDADQPPGEVRTPWTTLYLLWTDTVRYTVNTDEIRKLLLSYPETLYMMDTAEGGHAGDSPASVRAFQQAAANMALAWRLTLLRRVCEALLRHEDTKRCEDDLEELQTHSEELYRRCIAPLEQRKGRRPRRHSAFLSLSFAASPPDASSWAGGEDAVGEQPLLLCSPPRAWLHLTLALEQLKRLSRQLTVLSVGSLFRYMYASSRSKYLAGVMLAMLTGLASRVTSAGMRAREAVAQVLGGFYYRHHHHTEEDHGSPSGESSTTFLIQLLSLSCFELIRLTVNTVLVTMSKEFISVTASQRRDAVKAQLYEALTHMPLSFFDLYAYDAIEEMVYYVNDLEGVDVHVHQYFFTAITAFATMRLSLAPLNRQARLLVLGTVAASYSVQWVGGAVGRWYQRLRQQHLSRVQGAHGGLGSSSNNGGGSGSGGGGPLAVALGSFMGVSLEHGDGGDDGDSSAAPASSPLDGFGGEGADAQEAENLSSSPDRDGIMLRGLEIIAALPHLRPYGADVTLMAWWNGYVTRRVYGGGGAKQGGIFGALLRDAHGQLVPALGSAVLTFVNWFLPLFTSVYGAHTAARHQDAGPATASGRLLDATNAVKTGVEAFLDARRVLDVVLSNGYKARVIERILSPQFWESAAAEDIERVGAYAAEHSWDSATVKPPPVLLYRLLTHQHADTMQAATAAAPSTRSYEDLVVTRVSIRELQFAYPSNPTVPVFARPLNAEIQLQDPETGRGRFVCITGPSGYGKSTILHLLLGLYTTYTSSSSGPCPPSAAAAATGPPITLQLAYKGGRTGARRGGADLRGEEEEKGERSEEETATATVASATAAAAAATTGPLSSFRLDKKGDVGHTVSLREIPCGVLRRQFFSYVPQYPTVFAGATIAHNVSLAPYVSIEEAALLAKVRVCTDEAHCGFIHRFPQGLLTPVGNAASLWSGASGASPTDGGGLVRLSGGQAQRLMVARALYHGGGVLLMDEPTASLDAATRKELLKEWRQLLNRGVVSGILCATHDDMVVDAADEVIYLAQD